MRHVTRELFTSHIWISHVTHMDEACHTYEWVIYFGRYAMSAEQGVRWRIHMCDTTHPRVWHGSSICVIWLIHMCDILHPNVWYDSFIRVIRLIHICDMTHSYMCDMTHSYMWHDSSICVTSTSHCDLARYLSHLFDEYLSVWLIHMCDEFHEVLVPCKVLVTYVWRLPLSVTHPYVWRIPRGTGTLQGTCHICVTTTSQCDLAKYFLHMCDKSMSRVWHELRNVSRGVVCWRIRMCTCVKVISHTWMSHVTHMDKSCHTYRWVMYLGRHAISAVDGVLQCVAVCCSVLQCVAVCCSVLQRTSGDTQYQQ